MRDLQTIRLAIEAAATGHLVFGTLHPQGAAKTVDRIIGVFPASQQEQIRSTLAESLKAVIAQMLFKRIDVKGRCGALEILICTPACANLIRKNKTIQLPSVMQTGREYGMQSMDHAIEGLLQKCWIAPPEAYAKGNDKAKFAPFLAHKPVDLWE
jgi:twitching motility protein PilT